MKNENLRACAVLLLVGIAVGAGVTALILNAGTKDLRNQLAATAGQLDEARQSFIDARKHGDDLGKQLSETQDRLRLGIDQLAGSVSRLGEIGDSAGRIVYLTREIRSVVEILRRAAGPSP